MSSKSSKITYPTHSGRIQKPRPSHQTRKKPSLSPKFLSLATSLVLKTLRQSGRSLSSLSKTVIHRQIAEQLDELLDLKDELEVEHLVDALADLKRLGGDLADVLDAMGKASLSESKDEDEDESESELPPLPEEDSDEDGLLDDYADSMEAAAETEWSPEEIDAGYLPLLDDEDEDLLSDEEDEGDDSESESEEASELPDI